jgi:hypothetical protein
MTFRPSYMLLCVCAGLAFVPAASAQQSDKELTAKARVFAEVGAGIRSIAKDHGGRYYILTAPSPALALYDPAGKRVGQIPGATTGSPSAKQAALVFGDDLDVDAIGRVYVADRGGNAVKVYRPDGSLLLSVPVISPSSVVAVGEDEFAVAGLKSSRLVTVYNLSGKVVREFGDPSEAAERQDLNQYLNIGRLATDPAGDIYYAFSYLPEPTVRKYDRYGYAAYEAVQETLAVYPTAQAARREIWKQEAGGKAPVLKPTVTALAVDPVTQELWMAVGGTLLHFDRDGNRRASYRTYTPEGARLETVAILVEANRLLLAADPLGIYEFTRPDKILP